MAATHTNSLEHRTEPLLPRAAFRRRLLRYGSYAAVLLGVSLAGGTLGFWYFAEQRGIDALLNAAMLLGGMGPVGEIRCTSGKLFATFFALYAGLAFIGVAGILLTPISHRILHKFHLEEEHRRLARARAGAQPRSVDDPVPLQQSQRSQ